METPLIFRCSLAFQDIKSNKGQSSSQLLDYMEQDDTNINVTTRRLLGRALYNYLRLGPLKGSNSKHRYFGGGVMSTGISVMSRGIGVENYDDEYELFLYAIGLLNTTHSELWLASYIAYNLGVRLEYLNQILRRIQIEHERHGIRTTLRVKWWRVAGTLGVLLIFQIVFASMALAYCHGSMEIPDEVPQYANMFENFPWETVQQPPQQITQGHKEYSGRFAPENRGYRWIFETKVD